MTIQISGGYPDVADIQSGLATASALTTVDGIVDSILEDTGTTLPATLAGLATASALTTVDGIVDSILEDTGTTLPATLAGLATASALTTVDGIVDSILEDTGTTLPATLAGLATASALAEIDTDLSEIEGHFHTRARWFGKKAVQTSTDWADDTLTPFRAISGNNAYGADANDEAQVFGTADTVIAGQTHFDMDKIMVVAASSTNVYKLRFVYGTGTMADAITAGQYTETMVIVASPSSRLTKEDIRMPQLNIGSHKVWCQAWNGTNDATIDFYVGIHGYTL